MSTSETADFWNASAKNYDRTEQRFEYIHRRSRDLTQRHLRGSDVVLDYGCGTGTATCELAHLVKEIHAIDISSTMIQIATEKAEAAKLENVAFASADLFDDAFTAESFDVVFAFNVLHTISNPDMVLRRLHEVLKPGGLIISVTPCFRERKSLVGLLQAMVVRILCWTGAIPIPIRSVTASEIDELVAGGGSFQIVDNETIFEGVSSYFMVAQKVGERR